MDLGKLIGKIILLIILVAFADAIFLRFSRSLAFPDVDNKFLEDGEARLHPNRPVSQFFTADRNNLNQVDVAIRNFNQWSKDKIVFNLKDEACDKTIATGEIGRFSPDYTIYTPFAFPAISDSQGKTYCVEVAFATNKENLDENQLPFIVYSRLKGNVFTNSGEDDEDNPGSARIYSGKTLVMKPAYGSGNFKEDIKILNDRVSQYKPWFLKHDYLYAISISFVILSVVLVVILIV
jgi:hypothetical protein